MKDGAHLAAGLFVELGEEILLLGILAGDEMGGDEIVDVGEEGIAGFGAAFGGWIVGFIGDLIEDAAGDDGTGGFGFGAGFGDDAAENVVGDFLEGLGIFETAAHGAEGGKKIATFEEAIGVEVLEFGECQAQFGAMITGEGEAQFDAELGGEMFNLIAIHEDRAAAEKGIENTAAGATGEITHNEYLERRVRFRGGVNPALAGLDIQHYVRIRSFWHLVIPQAIGIELPQPYFTRETILLGNHNE